MAGEIQRALNILSSTISGGAVALAKGIKQPKTKDSNAVFTGVKPGLQYSPVYDNETAAVKATSMANEAIKSKAVRAQSARTGKFVGSVYIIGGKKNGE